MTLIVSEPSAFHLINFLRLYLLLFFILLVSPTIDQIIEVKIHFFANVRRAKSRTRLLFFNLWRFIGGLYHQLIMLKINFPIRSRSSSQNFRCSV